MARVTHITYDPEDPATYEQFRMPNSSFHSEKYRLMMQSISKTRGLKVLEVGSGTGIYTRFLVNDFDNVIATDLDASMCSQAQKLIPKAKVLVADACKLPFKDNSFDGVFGVSILHHVPDRAAAFREVFRVLKPNGWFAFCEPNKYNPLTLAVQMHFREPALTFAGMRKDATIAGLIVTGGRTILLRSPRTSAWTDKIPGWRIVEKVASSLNLGFSVYIVGRKRQ